MPNDLTAKFGNIFDNFAFTERASFRKDVIDYLLIETLHKGFETLFCPGPEMGMLFSAFMSSNVSGTVTVGGLEHSIKHIALRIADRYRYRFNNAWERAEKEHPEDAARLAEPEAVELKKFILEGNTLDSFFEGMIQNALKIDSCGSRPRACPQGLASKRRNDKDVYVYQGDQGNQSDPGDDSLWGNTR